MKYLLDSHVILWLAYEDDKLSKAAKEILLDPKNEIFLSAVSFWEIGLKFQSGKLDLKGHNPEILKAGFDQYFDFRQLNLDLADATTIFKLDASIHKDPFDRMLIWQALSHGLTLITADENIQRYRGVGLKVVW
ncbi:PIN domain nuclease, a component of toxin-antitoxin system (PIN domain) [Algoriphagus alkaliphilus]|uniref:PIN domain nuclease, a component of toxin-antitoxin system (PIN domain) n=1 Tax=Algoriphagus alkaliphilus TaxID=279824 RepID=A0A1G5VUJ0_9BACT|nr:type II toxin-antitoxin system VapC family toxin [Algoriphagus alkaliphilus]MBA4298564.1 twitching motility protein PilT [Cyclobacterium sp.]SDA48887.1 PIN domain nuclease, a component of toxin-antitoxin system (PIN domain) [Algoriphagus alkaliphilus]